jgi:hypothetical protein
MLYREKSGISIKRFPPYGVQPSKLTFLKGCPANATATGILRDPRLETSGQVIGIIEGMTL